MMTMISWRAPDWTARLPAGIYLAGADLVLSTARRLFVWRVIDRHGLIWALTASNRLSRAAIRSWRIRRR